MGKTKNVSVGKPRVAGSIFLAPVGTAVPTSAISKLNEAFKDLGYVSEDGVTNENTRDSEEIKAWGGDTVLQPQTAKTDTFGMTLIETKNIDVLKAVYGENNVTGELSSGITIKANAQELPYGIWVIDMIMTDGDLKRVVLPNAKITEISEISYKDDEATGYEVKITAFPDNEENTHYEYIQSTTSV